MPPTIPVRASMHQNPFYSNQATPIDPEEVNQFPYAFCMESYMELQRTIQYKRRLLNYMLAKGGHPVSRLHDVMKEIKRLEKIREFICEEKTEETESDA